MNQRAKLKHLSMLNDPSSHLLQHTYTHTISYTNISFNRDINTREFCTRYIYTHFCARHRQTLISLVLFICIGYFINKKRRLLRYAECLDDYVEPDVITLYIVYTAEKIKPVFRDDKADNDFSFISAPTTILVKLLSFMCV